MGTVLLLTKALQPSADVLPGLALLSHQVKILPAEGSALLEAPESDLVLVGDQPVGTLAPEAVVVPPGATVEFLPPFAGG